METNFNASTKTSETSEIEKRIKKTVTEIVMVFMMMIGLSAQGKGNPDLQKLMENLPNKTELSDTTKTENIDFSTLFASNMGEELAYVERSNEAKRIANEVLSNENEGKRNEGKNLDNTNEALSNEGEKLDKTIDGQKGTIDNNNKTIDSQNKEYEKLKKELERLQQQKGGVNNTFSVKKPQGKQWKPQHTLPRTKNK